MKELNIASNFIVLLTTLWACLSPRVPCRTIGQIILCCIALSCIVNIEVTNSLTLSISGLIFKSSVALGCIWLIFHFEKEIFKSAIDMLFTDVKSFFKRDK